MQTYQPSLVGRSDTLLGVCAAIGEDFGFNPIWLRVVFAITVFFNLFLAIALYFAIGAVVLLSRCVYPNARSRPAVAPVAAAPALVDGVTNDPALLAAA